MTLGPGSVRVWSVAPGAGDDQPYSGVSVAPAGRWAAFERVGELLLVECREGGRRSVVKGNVRGWFSEDGGSIGLVRQIPDGFDGDWGNTWVMDLESGEETDAEHVPLDEIEWPVGFVPSQSAGEAEREGGSVAFRGCTLPYEPENYASGTDTLATIEEGEPVIYRIERPAAPLSTSPPSC